MPTCGGKAVDIKKASFSGKVVKVLDGDTIEVMRDGKAVRIRLSEIDCPEKSQPFGDKAKRFTAELAAGKLVTVNVKTIDRYGRTVAEVILNDGRSLNAEILKAGLAWWYRDYSDDKSLGVLETQAKSARKGLWADKDPIPPWVFRRRE
jgi:endonuclease YncB( thermonuclease family)